MAGETVITVVGNLTADPELRYTQNGLAVANFSIASTPRTFDRQANEWKDGEALFLRCSIWREAAEQVSASLKKGMRVIAQGNLTQRSYQDREGNQRTAVELEVQEIGPSLRYATAQVQRVQSNGQGGQQQGQQQPQQQGYPQQGPPQQQAPQQGPPQQGYPQQGAPQQQPQQGYPQQQQQQQQQQQAPQQQAPMQQQQQQQQPMQGQAPQQGQQPMQGQQPQQVWQQPGAVTPDQAPF